MQTSFDKHSHITYSDLSHLYWGEFAYRVSVQVPLNRTRRCRSRLGVYELRDRYLNELVHHVEPIFRLRATGANYFFTTAEQAEQFIDSNAEKITEVVRPVEEAEIDLLRDRRIRFREKLYYDRYQWCLTFVGDTWRDGCLTTQEVDDFVRELFNPEGLTEDETEDRFRYRPRRHSKRKLYLADEADVILVKLSMEEQNIESMECVKLRSPVSDE